MGNVLIDSLENMKYFNTLIFENDKHINGNRHQAVAVAIRAWTELCNGGFASKQFMPFQGDDSVVYVYDKEFKNIISLIVYRIDKDRRTAIIQLGWTDPAHRKNGVYKRLLRYFERQLHYSGIVVYETIVSSNNENMSKISTSRDAVGTFYRKRIDV